MRSHSEDCRREDNAHVSQADQDIILARQIAAGLKRYSDLTATQLAKIKPYKAGKAA